MTSEFVTTLPFLPGYNVEIGRKDRYHKSHFFEVQNGTRIDHSHHLAVAATIPASHTEPVIIDPEEALGSSLKNLNVGTAALSRVPAWVAYDRQVLRFFGYFTEPVHSSPAETWRVRRCTLYMYLEDESIHIAEPKVENSGIPQGVFVKRHRIPRAEANSGVLGVADLGVGFSLNIYGRTFILTDCDAFTREFYEANDMPQSEPLELPVDPFTQAHTVDLTHSHNKTMHPHKRYMEASLGKPMLPSKIKTKQFLAMDGHVLRFYAQWNDTKMYGEKRPYTIHYYLADDTVEVQEIQQPNSGRDPFPTLLKRARLAKQWNEGVPNVANLGALGEGTQSGYYNALDFKVGATIDVYGRQLLICGADEFTQNYFEQVHNIPRKAFQSINMSDPITPVATLVPPPYNGYGTEEDSLGSFLFLMPKVPKADFKKLMHYDGVNLRFLARLIHPCSKVDRERRFIVTYYAAGDQMSLFEKCDRNSGFLGGKFLEKSRLKNPVTNQWYHMDDLVIGAHININEYEFEIIEMDEFTQKWRAQNRQSGKSAVEEKTQ